MRIKGFTPQSMVDWPNKVVAVLFTGGCNFNCLYCHNSQLIRPSEPWMDEEKLLDDLRQRQWLLDGVVITGGEPTLHPDLFAFLERLKGDNWKIKLDTNGTNPELLKRILDHQLVDYVAMDWKVPLAGDLSERLLGVTKGLMRKVEESARVLAQSEIEVEWRTTCSYGLGENELFQMAEELKRAVGDRKINWYLQRYFTPSQGDPDPGQFSAPLKLEELKEIITRLPLTPSLRSWS